jgi:hypothetical protein
MFSASWSPAWPGPMLGLQIQAQTQADMQAWLGIFGPDRVGPSRPGCTCPVVLLGNGHPLMMRHDHVEDLCASMAWQGWFGCGEARVCRWRLGGVVQWHANFGWLVQIRKNSCSKCGWRLQRCSSWSVFTLLEALWWLCNPHLLDVYVVGEILWSSNELSDGVVISVVPLVGGIVLEFDTSCGTCGRQRFWA